MAHVVDVFPGSCLNDRLLTLQYPRWWPCDLIDTEKINYTR